MYYIVVSVVGSSTETKETFLVEPTRYDAHIETVAGTLYINGPATVYLVWDNEYSWFNSKDLAYSIDLSEMRNNNASENKERIESKAERIMMAVTDRVQAVGQGRESIRYLNNAVDSINCSLSDLQYQIESLQEEVVKTERQKEVVLGEKESMQDDIGVWRMHINSTF